jgi:serine/threonine-protein kinase
MDFIRLLGRGSGGEVWEGWYEGRKVAIKKMIQSPKSINEAKIASQIDCKHKNLLCLIGQEKTREVGMNFHYLIYEFVSNAVPLNELVREGKLSEWKTIEILNMMYEICDGIEHLHNNNILHMDIKLQNILVKEFIPMIIDYDLSCWNKCRFEGIRGTANYISPEMWNSKEVDQKTDIYSLGVVFYRMIDSKFPYSALNENGIKRLVTSLQSPLPIENTIGLPEEIFEILSDLIMKMLEKDPKERLNMIEIKEIILELIKQ